MLNTLAFVNSLTILSGVFYVVLYLRVVV